jgi:hypothetical protein
MENEKFKNLVKGLEPLDETTAEELKNLVRDFPAFQLGWVMYAKNLKQINSPDFDSVLKRVAILVSDRKLLYRFLNNNNVNQRSKFDLEKDVPQSYSLKGESDLNHGDSLIDKFLQTSPGAIRKPNNESDDLSNDYLKQVVEKSVDENSEIVTETLALIYFQQKNYNKAQEAYQKLSLKYPEKSVYFATRIKEIEKLKNL